jgi:hypothetical protein
VHNYKYFPFPRLKRARITDDQIIAVLREREAAATIVSDHSTEFTLNAMLAWAGLRSGLTALLSPSGPVFLKINPGAPASGASPSAIAELHVGACGVQYIIPGFYPEWTLNILPITEPVRQLEVISGDGPRRTWRDEGKARIVAEIATSRDTA